MRIGIFSAGATLSLSFFSPPSQKGWATVKGKNLLPSGLLLKERTFSPPLAPTLAYFFRSKTISKSVSRSYKTDLDFEVVLEGKNPIQYLNFLRPNLELFEFPKTKWVHPRESINTAHLQ